MTSKLKIVLLAFNTIAMLPAPHGSLGASSDFLKTTKTWPMQLQGPREAPSLETLLLPVTIHRLQRRLSRDCDRSQSSRCHFRSEWSILVSAREKERLDYSERCPVGSCLGLEAKAPQPHRCSCCLLVYDVQLRLFISSRELVPSRPSHAFLPALSPARTVLYTPPPDRWRAATTVSDVFARQSPSLSNRRFEFTQPQTNELLEIISIIKPLFCFCSDLMTC